ncbi:M23 family metallopeptidase [Clostridium sp. KNHs205]|uniref:M23 family metallopeptidase n=1 Tax=Clostridium sp. KNHs205 TaxID=1449050 RepID=UPI000A9BBC3B|nr:M23 family metallopeptidase [Clostridium sp. KNHs205]
MKNRLKNFGYLNLIVLLILSIMWIAVFFVKGLPGAVSWGVLKLIIPFAGLPAILINILLIVINLIRNQSISRRIAGLLVSGIAIFPILLTMNVLQFAYPADINKVTPAVTVAWPFKEEAVIGFGGNREEDNLPHAVWASERWAYDIVMKPYTTGSKDPDSYGIWDKEVYSPVSGVVVEAYDEEEDILANTEEFISSEGNHVYIRINTTGTYLLLNHLKKNSLVVKTGDEVKTGDYIGRVGNSGSTSEPHLHIHHQRQNPTKMLLPVFAEGLPLYFKGIKEPMSIKGSVIKP